MVQPSFRDRRRAHVVTRRLQRAASGLDTQRYARARRIEQVAFRVMIAVAVVGAAVALLT